MARFPKIHWQSKGFSSPAAFLFLVCDADKINPLCVYVAASWNQHWSSISRPLLRLGCTRKVAFLAAAALVRAWQFALTHFSENAINVERVGTLQLNTQ